MNILSYSTGQGFTVIGQAKTAKSAEKIIRKLICFNKNTKLNVFARTDLMIELNGGSKGWIYSAYYN